ncbi:MAG: hypothetical protein JNN20_00690 [Betaproteobacteria bacterium]|nr:hypothetical protein [Betaproteobacteria bacterium]
MPSTEDGKVNTSNCLGTKSVRYDFDGVPMWVSLRGSGAKDPPSQLVMGLTLADGHTARIPVPEIRLKPLNDGAEESYPLPAWERSVLRWKLSRNKQLERVTVETGPAAGPLIGGKPNDGDNIFGPAPTKTFVASIPLKGLPAPAYHVQLPAIEINGKLHAVEPIKYRHEVRVKFMVPVNC